jgi:hypothetical protein
MNLYLDEKLEFKHKRNFEKKIFWQRIFISIWCASQMNESGLNRYDGYSARAKGDCWRQCICLSWRKVLLRKRRISSRWPARFCRAPGEHEPGFSSPPAMQRTSYSSHGAGSGHRACRRLLSG